jgi:hypothetical protein
MVKNVLLPFYARFYGAEEGRLIDEVRAEVEAGKA